MDDPLLERARRQLEANTREALVDGRRYVYTIPSPRRYRFQWHWDSCFHAVVWAAIDRGRAEDELRALVARQRSDGLLPHVVYWDRALARRSVSPYLESAGLGFPAASAQVQPPVIAPALELVAAGEAGESFVRELLPAVARHYRHLAVTRDRDGDGLVSVISQFETGLDFSPIFDPAPGHADPSPRALRRRARAAQVLNRALNHDPRLVLRMNPLQWQDVLVNSVYVDGLDALARLAARGGDDDLRRWAETQSGVALAALLERCYDEHAGLFFSLGGRRRRQVRVRTIVSLAPLLCEALPGDVAARLVEHLTDPRVFWPEYPVPSVALDEPSFVPTAEIRGERCIWRGPCAPSTNWLLCRGLRRHGYAEEADRIAARTRASAEAGGFNEFYNPVDGAPVGVTDFGWGTLAAVM